MAAVTRLGLYGGPRAPYAGFAPAAATVALTGTVTTATEADIVAGGKTLILTVTNDTWVATVGADNSITTALINGLDSDGAEAGGWDAVVKAGLTHTAVTRTSDTVVTITLPAFASYDITANETITATVPDTALSGGVQTVASPTFTVSYVPATAAATDRGAGSGGAHRRIYSVQEWLERRGLAPAQPETPDQVEETEPEAENAPERPSSEERELQRLEGIRDELQAQERLSRRMRARLRDAERQIERIEERRNEDEALLLLLLVMME